MYHFNFVNIFIFLTLIQTKYLADGQIEITEVKQTGADNFSIKWNSAPSRYRVFVKNLDEDTEIEWPCQYKLYYPNENKTIEGEWFTETYDYNFDCMNECIRSTYCKGVTIETIKLNDIHKVKCSFKNLSNIISTNDSKKSLIFITSDANETIVRDLDYGFKYQFRVEIYINQRWESTRWSREIDLKLNLTLVQERIGIFKYRINWLQQAKFTYPISRYNVSLNGKIIPILNTSEIINLTDRDKFFKNENYYQYPLDNMVKLDGSIRFHCVINCINIQNCIQSVFQNGFCYAQTRLRRNKAIYKLTNSDLVFIARSDASSYDVTLEPHKETKFKLSYMYLSGKVLETDEINLFLNKADVTPLLEIANFLTTDLSVKLKWTLTGLNSTYIRGAYIYQNINSTEQSPIGVSAPLEYTFSNLRLNKNYSFKVQMVDNDGIVTDLSDEVTISEPFNVQLKPFNEIFVEGSTNSLVCSSNVNKATIRKITFYKEEKEIKNQNDNNTYTFNSLQETDSGQYMCKIELKNKQTMNSDIFNLQVQKKTKVTISSAKQLDVDKVELTIKTDGSDPNKENITRYQVSLSTDGFRMDINSFWPAQLVKQDRDLEDEHFYSTKASSFFECFNECIKHPECVAVTAKALSTFKVDCFLKSSTRNKTKSTLTANTEHRVLQEFNNEKKIVLTNLPFNQKYQFKVSIYDDTKKEWSPFSEQKEVTMSFKGKNIITKDVKASIIRIGIKKFNISWQNNGNFSDYPISRISILTNKTNAPLIDTMGELIYSVSLEPNYFDPKIEISNIIHASNKEECYNKCKNDSGCVHYVYLKKQISEIPKGSCFLKKTFDIQKGISFDPQFVETAYLKTTLKDQTYNVDEALNMSITAISPYGSKYVSTHDTLVSPNNITPVLKSSNFIDTNLSVVLSWTINGIDMKYIKQAIVNCRLNDTQNTNCGFNTTHNTVVIPNLRFNKNIAYIFTVSLEDYFGEITQESNMTANRVWPLYVNLTTTPNQTFFLETTSINMSCYFDTFKHKNYLKQEYIETILWYKNDKIVNTTKNTFLILENVSESLSGKYKCKINLTNNQSLPSRESIELQILKIDLEIDSRGLIEGKDTSLKCKFTQIEEKYVESVLWYKDGEIITNLENMTFSNRNRTIQLTPLSRNIHNGIYQCVLNTNKTTTQPLSSQNVTIISKSINFSANFNLSSTFNESVETEIIFICSVEGYDTQNISILLDDKTLNKRKPLSFEYTSNNTITLKYDRLNRTHNGTYICATDNDELESEPINLIVYYKPDLEVTHNGLNAASAYFSTSKCNNCKIEISCTMRGYSNRIPTTSWLYANGTKVHEKHLITSNSEIHYTSVLTFQDVERQYDGSYICINSENKTEKRNFNLYITSPPSKPVISRAQIFPNRAEIEFTIDDDGRMPISNARVELLGKEKTYPIRLLKGDNKKGTIIITGEIPPKDTMFSLRLLSKEGFSEYSDKRKLECNYFGCNKSEIFGVIFGSIAVATTLLGLYAYLKKEKIKSILSKKKFTEIELDYIPQAKVPIETIVNNWIENIETIENQLNSEYSEIKNSKNVPFDEANDEINLPKNRYKNIFPYDYNRVILQQYENVPSSDYINASKIKGYNDTNKFIAAQGPLRDTVTDFWRMIYEKRVRAVVMLTNFKEGQREKCAEYWENLIQIEDFIIEMVEYENNLNYQKRKFLVKNINNAKYSLSLDHYHYANWPDHSVPEDTQTIVELIDRVNKEHDKNDWPILVHCSAGVGRTGTYIALDILLQMLRREREVDIKYCVNRLRQQRVYMVQTKEQYKFIYLTLIEHSIFGDTIIDRNSCAILFQTLSKSNEINQLFKKICEVPDAHRSTTAHSEFSSEFNSTQFVPYDDSLVELEKIAQNQFNVYFDATSFTTKQFNADFYIASIPTEQNVQLVSEFLKLVLERRPTFIVSFSSSNCYPNLKCIYKTNDQKFQVENKASSLVNQVEYHEIVISSMKNNETHTVLYFDHTANWPQDCKFPINGANFMKLINVILSWDHRNTKPLILVQSNDGGDRCALFIASLLLLNRIRIHDKFDVVQVVRMLRKTRKNLISDAETFNYLYRICCDDVGA